MAKMVDYVLFQAKNDPVMSKMTIFLMLRIPKPPRSRPQTTSMLSRDFIDYNY